MKLVSALLFLLCVHPCLADSLYVNTTIYTVNPDLPQAHALYVVDGKIAFVGSEEQARAQASNETEVIDLHGRTMIPGFIEGHGHIMGLGLSKLNLDLMHVANYEDLVEKVAVAVDSAEKGEWITGRGWHQSKWVPQPGEMIKGFQTHTRLSEVSPDNPVYLVHASGHAGFVNAKAMEIAGITKETEFSGDGEIIRDDKGEATGVLNEIAQSLVRKHVPPPSQAQRERALTLAMQELAENGVTSFQDAGSLRADVELYKQFLHEKKLTSRLWVMLSGRDYPHLLSSFGTSNPHFLSSWFKKGPEIDLGDGRLTIRAIKLVADGALGSRGAWLLEPYLDRPGHVGLPTMSIEAMSDISHQAYQHGFQIGIHAIGDRANREVLNIFDRLFDGKDRGVRFRIEHAQHIAESDIPRFARLGVIASVQGIHMSSDRLWAIDRLGIERIKEGAYVWRKLVDSGAIMMNGTDAPVEPVNPIASFYSLVTRQTLKGEPEGGFEPEQKLSREEALISYTLAAAYGAFEEDQKGSLEVGKWADFTVLDRDIMKVPDAELLQTAVLMTVVGGEVIFEKPRLEKLIGKKE
ncbi:MAG: amidohydrolase [Gammaproteobacteria bacterium]|nr:amidohydrolase [Gammaproteobacteria bacterium]